MARLELIKELRLRRKEIYSELKDQYPELMEELNAIDKITERSRVSYVKDDNIAPTYTAVTPKGNMSWDYYVLYMLREIGGIGKSSDVARAIVSANNDITLRRAKEACSDHLSKHLASGKITATKGSSKKDGYVYEIV